MKRNKLIVVLVVSMFLFMAPSIVSSVDYEVSNQSITSFSETLPDDVLFYPDGETLSKTLLASSGYSTGEHPEGSYESTHTVGGEIYYVDDYHAPRVTAIYLDFTIPYIASGTSIYVAVYTCYDYAYTEADVNYVSVGGQGEWVDFGDVPVDQYYPHDEEWVNFTISTEYIVGGDTLNLLIYLENDDNILLRVDYAEVTFDYISTLSEDSYAENFADISDCGSSAEVSISTDGDMIKAEQAGDSTYRYFFVNGISMTSATGFYLEYSLSANVSTSLIVYTGTTDDGGSTTEVRAYDTGGPTAETWKVLITHSEIVECIAFRFRATADVSLYSDYLRVSPSDETGFQHDGSTDEGISSPDGGTIASDSDLVTLTADGDGSTFLIVADTTTTVSAISTKYYPFFGIDIDSGSGSWTLEQYDGSAYATLQSSTTISAGIKHFNMLSLDAYVSWWRITLSASSVLVGDWAKAYSIADFSIFTQHAEMDTNDYFYTVAGVLYCESDEANNRYMRMNYDPPLDIDYETYTIVNSTVFKDGQQSDLVGYNWIDDGGILQDAWNASLTQDLTGNPYLKIDDAGSWEIHDLSFLYQIPDWENINNPILIFSVPLDETTLDALLIFFGLIMIPASTIYLVHGGRENASKDKVFYFLVAFIFGWALLIGGILI